MQNVTNRQQNKPAADSVQVRRGIDRRRFRLRQLAHAKVSAGQIARSAEERQCGYADRPIERGLALALLPLFRRAVSQCVIKRLFHFLGSFVEFVKLARRDPILERFV